MRCRKTKGKVKIMKLTFEEIKSITVGAVNMREEENGIHFYKCTDKQNEAWDKLSETLGLRARTTTGVRLDFVTTSQKLTMKATGGKFEIYVDDLLRTQHVLNGFTEITEEFSLLITHGSLHPPLLIFKKTHTVSPLQKNLVYSMHGRYEIRHIGTKRSKKFFDGESITAFPKKRCIKNRRGAF